MDHSDVVPNSKTVPGRHSIASISRDASVLCTLFTTRCVIYGTRNATSKGGLLHTSARCHGVLLPWLDRAAALNMLEPSFHSAFSQSRQRMETTEVMVVSLPTGIGPKTHETFTADAFKPTGSSCALERTAPHCAALLHGSAMGLVR